MYRNAKCWILWIESVILYIRDDFLFFVPKDKVKQNILIMLSVLHRALNTFMACRYSTVGFYGMSVSVCLCVCVCLAYIVICRIFTGQMYCIQHFKVWPPGACFNASVWDVLHPVFETRELKTVCFRFLTVFLFAIRVIFLYCSYRQNDKFLHLDWKMSSIGNA